MCFVKGATRNFILKFSEIFPWRETVLRSRGMKSDLKPFYGQILGNFSRKKMELSNMLWLTDIFFLFLKGFEDFFLNPKRLLIVPLNFMKLKII